MTHLGVAAGLSEAQQRPQQLLLLSCCQPPLFQQALSSFRQHLCRDGRPGPAAALSMLPGVEVALNGAELQLAGALMLRWQA